MSNFTFSLAKHKGFSFKLRAKYLNNFNRNFFSESNILFREISSEFTKLMKIMIYIIFDGTVYLVRGIMDHITFLELRCLLTLR